jgi:hypothetical protein
MLNVAMAEVRLQGARVGALVGKLKATGVPNMCGWALKPSLAATSSRKAADQGLPCAQYSLGLIHVKRHWRKKI